MILPCVNVKNEKLTRDNVKKVKLTRDKPRFGAVPGACDPPTPPALKLPLPHISPIVVKWRKNISNTLQEIKC